MDGIRSLNRKVRPIPDARYGFFGDYFSWREALGKSSGYNHAGIIEKVRAASLKVLHGEAACERDSVTFPEIQYSWPVLAGLLWIAAKNHGRLEVIDFGGSLGSGYFQMRKFLNEFDVIWHIVEQPAFVDIGKREFESDRLRFHFSLEECPRREVPMVLLLASTIQYLENPFTFLRNAFQMDFEYCIFDRTSFLLDAPDRITLQIVPPDIYEASYPCWFFNLPKFKQFCSQFMTLVEEFRNSDVWNVPDSVFMGMIYSRSKDRKE